jgi:subtilisin family serine protease
MGVSDKIVIMPVVMVSTGDEHDEDVAKAIRYAVDNGAHIINMSWGKYYSSQTQLVREAIIYAAEHDVLLVTASGNEGKDIDQELFYPIDFYDGKEVVSNFLVAGGLTHKADSALVASFSNYGKEQVDIFAPAARIYSANPDNQYDYGQGTSNASPILAGVAALLKGYYPDLSASEIKEILLASGDSIDLKVVKPGAEGEAPLVPFSSLSKTGKILNAYRALLLAEERSD